MTQQVLPFGDWRPDVALLDNQFISVAENVYTGANAYLPMPSLSNLDSSTVGTGNDGYTKVMLYFDGADASTTITDNNVGGIARTWTAAGNAQIDTAQSKFGGSSLLCDGTGDWVSTSTITDLDPVANDFTIECFARPATDGALLYICGCADSGLNASQSMFVIRRTAANKVEALVSNGSAFTTLTGASTNFTTGAFKHVRLLKTGTTVKLFLDGALEASGTVTGTVSLGGNPLIVGAGGSVTTTPWNGWIDGFRYDLGIARDSAAAFTPPTVDYDSCRGLFMARMTTRLNAFFAGTVRKIWKYTHAAGAWTDVTISGGVYSLAPGDLWSFAQFGANVYATQASNVLQSIDATSGTNFAATAGSPPQADHVATIGDFLVLSGLASDRKAIQWSAINDPTGWTIGTNLSDSQTMPDGGDVKGVCGDSIGYVMQDRAIRSMQFLPGDTDRIFAFSKVENERGTVGKLSFCYTNGTIFSRGEDGFYAWQGGIQPIGQDAVNKWFNTETASGGVVTRDTTRRPQIVVFAPPDAPRIFFAYHYGAVGGGALATNGSTSNYYDRVLIYDYSLNRWSYSKQGAQMWAALANSVLIRQVGGVDTSGRMALLNSTNQAATIDTAEFHLNPGMRTFVNNVYPLVDIPTAVTVTPYTREDFQFTSTAGTAAVLESTTGWASILSSGRLHRFRVAIAAGSWTFANGLMVDHQPDGEA